MGRLTTGSISHWVVDSSMGRLSGSTSHWVEDSSIGRLTTGSTSHWVVDSSMGTLTGSTSHWVEDISIMHGQCVFITSASSSSADLVLDNLVSTGQLEEDAREKVRAALLQRHLHLNSKKDHGEIKILDHFKYVLLPWDLSNYRH